MRGGEGVRHTLGNIWERTRWLMHCWTAAFTSPAGRGKTNLAKNQNLMSGGEGFVPLWEDLKFVFLDQLRTARLLVDSKLWSSTTLTFFDVFAH